MKKFLILCAILGFTTASMGDMFSFFEKSTVEKAQKAYESNDLKNAAELYGIACSQNDYKACWWAGYIHNSGIQEENKFKIDRLKAKKYFQKACDGGNLDGCKDAQAIQNGINQIEIFNNEIAYCERGNMNECASVGIKYYKGDSISRDMTKAENYTKKACDSGNLDACGWLTEIYYKQNKFFDAFETASKTCNAGHAAGCQSLGFLYENGQGTRISLDKAAEFYGKACDMKDTVGCQKYKQLQSPQAVQQVNNNSNYQQEQLAIQRQQLEEQRRQAEAQEKQNSISNFNQAMQNLSNSMKPAYTAPSYDALDMINAQKQNKQNKQTNYQLQQINNNLNGIRYGY